MVDMLLIGVLAVILIGSWVVHSKLDWIGVGFGDGVVVGVGIGIGIGVGIGFLIAIWLII